MLLDVKFLCMSLIEISIPIILKFFWVEKKSILKVCDYSKSFCWLLSAKSTIQSQDFQGEEKG